MKKQTVTSARILVLASFALLTACSAGPDEDGSTTSGTGSDSDGSGGVSQGSTTGDGTSTGDMTGSTAAAGGSTAAGGSGSNDAGSGGTLATGGTSSASGGTDAAGGSAATGGSTASGGSAPEDCDSAVRATKLEGYGASTKGGQGGSVVTASTGTEIHAAICNRAADDTPLTIMVDGTITPTNTLKQSGSCNTADGVIELKDISNVSLIGVGTNGLLDQIGVHIRNSENIILQNLTIKNVRKSNTSTPSNGGDAIGMESDVNNIWIDHNEIYGSTTEGEEHDGLIDFKDNTTNVTVSYNHLHDSGRGGLIGSNDDGDDGSTNITFHHNWYRNINSRTHLIREAQGHLFNNYYEDILSTGINARNGATLLIEGNYFENARNPLGTFYYLDNPGKWEANDNYFAPNVVWEPADDELVAGPDVKSTGTVSVPYEYALDPTECVPAIVEANSGVGKLK